MNSGDSIAIVGAGPAGLCCALWLVEAGYRVTVLEKQTGLPEDIRASTFHPATLDLLEGSALPGHCWGRARGLAAGNTSAMEAMTASCSI